MTQSLALINGGVAYAAGDALPAATVNAWTANTELAWANAVARMSPAVWVSSGWSSVGKWANGYIHALVLDSGATYSIKTLATGETFSDVVLALSMTDEGAMTICFNAGVGTWGAWPLGASTHSYLSNDETLGAWAQSTGVYFSALAAVSVGTKYFVAGKNATVGAVRRYTAATMALDSTFASSYANEFSDIASDGSSGVVAVSADGAARTTNGGTTWTAAALTAPAGAYGYPSVNWLASLSLYICSWLLDTGALAYSTSSTGATWTSWQVTSQVVIALSILPGISAPMVGIIAIGNTLVAPYVDDASQLGVMLSADGGASWHIGDCCTQISSLDYLRTIACGNMAAVVSLNTVAFSGYIASNDKENSVAL